MNTTLHFTTVESELIRSLPHETIKWLPVNTDLKVIGAIKSLLEGSSYHLKRFQDEEFGQAVKNMIKQAAEPYDFILLESRSEEHTSELQSRGHLVCRLLLEKK